MWVKGVIARLAETAAFVEVGAVVCERARTSLDMDMTAIHLLRDERTPTIAVDDVVVGLSDARRLQWMSKWPRDPQLARLREHHAAVGDDGDYLAFNHTIRRHGYAGVRLHSRLLPLVEPTGLLGMVRCAATQRLSKGQRRDLDTLASYASARLVRLGVTAAAVPTDILTPAQRCVARSAATGRSNAEIADVLGVSVDTVKKHLKDVFARLSIHTRTQLAGMFTRTAPDEGLPRGVSRQGDVVVTVPSEVRPP